MSGIIQANGTASNGTVAQPAVVDAAEIDVVLTAVRHNALALCAEASRPPSRLRVVAGTVTVELTWPDGPGEPDPVGTALVESRPAPVVPGPRPTPVPSTGPGVDPLAYIEAPSVGVFYRAPEPGAKPFVAEGDTVVAGQQVAILEVMKLMIPVEAAEPGRIVEILRPDTAAVEYGERLFALASAVHAAA